MNRPAFRPLEAFNKGEKNRVVFNKQENLASGKGLDKLAQHINCQIKPLRSTIHHKFLKGDTSKPYHTADELRTFFRDEVIDYGLEIEEDYRVLNLIRGGPRAGIIHPYNVAFNTQTLNGTNEEIIVDFMHDNIEDFPRTLDEFVEYYTTGTLKGNFAIPDFALTDIKTLTNKEGFIVKRLNKRLEEDFIKTYPINGKTTNKKLKELKNHYYTRDRINTELNKMAAQVKKNEALDGDISKTIDTIQFMINHRIDNGYTPHDATFDINRTSVTYDLYINRIHKELPKHQRGRKIDDRTDNIGDDKHMKDKHKIRSMYKAFKIIEVMNKDANFMTPPPEDLFRLNTLKERFLHRIYDNKYIDLRRVKRNKQQTYKEHLSMMRNKSRHLVDEVNEYKEHQDTKVFISNLTPYTPSKTSVTHYNTHVKSIGDVK